MPLIDTDGLIQAALRNKVVSFPTDTVPALAVRPDQAALIYQLKQRPAEKPLILMAASLSDVWDYVAGPPVEQEQWQAIACHYLPGALTLVLPASTKVSTAMNPTKSGTIGVRVPDLDAAQNILKKTGPLATTSANRSGAAPLEYMTAIAAQFPNIAVLDPSSQAKPEPFGSGQPSTVAQWSAQGLRILRQGSVMLDSDRLSDPLAIEE